MRVFLTGAAGFVGSNLLRQLLDAGDCEVAALVLPQFDLWRIAELLPRVRLVEGDLEAPAALEKTIADFAPDTVIHLAWKGVINNDRNDPSQTDNIAPSLALVKMAQRIGVKNWLGLGSQAEYGPQPRAVDETTPTAPTTLYGAAKLRVCVAAQRLCEIYGLRFGWLRLFSSYGPGDHPNWMIPYLIEKLLNGERPSLTAGGQLWDYIYVADAAEAIAAVARTPGASGVFNLGSGRAESLRKIVENIRDRIDPRLPLGFGEIPYRPDQVMRLEADISRLRAATGWAPRTPLSTGLARTIEWHNERRRKSHA